MKYNFLSGANRIGTNSVKWNFADNNPNVKDYAPLWIADMDFDVASEITEALVERAKHPIYGYIEQDQEIFDLIVDWQKRRHHVDISKDSIILSAGVCHSYYHILTMLLEKDEKVIITTPIYPPFFNIPEAANREVVECPLMEENGKYYFDFDLYEKMLKEDPKIRLFNLCNPYNPLGFCFSKEDLNKIAKISYKYGVYIHSDEIHNDLIMPGSDFHTILEVDEKYHKYIFTSCSPTKTFNLAGLKVCYLICENKKIYPELKKYIHASGLESINIFGIEALRACYKYGDKWLDECLSVIYENFKFVKKYIDENIPQIKFEIPEATYLGYLDLTAFRLPKNYVEKLVNEAHVQFNAGKSFKSDYRFLRINVACPKEQLELGLNHLRDWLKDHKYI